MSLGISGFCSKNTLWKLDMFLSSGKMKAAPIFGTSDDGQSPET
jgi:hypothetical protein